MLQISDRKLDEKLRELRKNGDEHSKLALIEETARLIRPLMHSVTLHTLGDTCCMGSNRSGNHSIVSDGYEGKPRIKVTGDSKNCSLKTQGLFSFVSSSSLQERRPIIVYGLTRKGDWLLAVVHYKIETAIGWKQQLVVQVATEVNIKKMADERDMMVRAGVPPSVLWKELLCFVGDWRESANGRLLAIDKVLNDLNIVNFVMNLSTK